MTIKYIQLSILLVLALISDIKTYKIKNNIVYPFIILGLLTNVYYNSLQGVKESLIGIMLPILLLFILYLLRMLGAGDIKLFSAIGSIMGYGFVFNTILYSIIAGGIISLEILIVKKNGRKRLVYLLKYLKISILTCSMLPYEDFNEKSDGSKFHFGYAVICGTIINIIVLFN